MLETVFVISCLSVAAISFFSIAMDFLSGGAAAETWRKQDENYFLLQKIFFLLQRIADKLGIKLPNDNGKGNNDSDTPNTPL